MASSPLRTRPSRSRSARTACGSDWIFGLSSWRERHGLEGGIADSDSALIEESFASTGAVVRGGRCSAEARGVTDGIEAALAEARAAAGERNVSVAGGASVVQQLLAAGLVDELKVHVAPLLFGGGLRLFGDLDGGPVELEPTRVLGSPEATHLAFRVSRSRT